MNKRFCIALTVLLAVCLLLPNFVSGPVLANTSGPSFPGTTESLLRGDIQWDNIGNIASENGSSATADVSDGKSTHWALGKNFGFSIPGGATINGIKVEAKISSSVSNDVQTDTNGVGVTKDSGTNFFTKSPADLWTTTLTWASYGSSSDLWGTTWTPSQINSTEFGAAISAFVFNGLDAAVSIDAIRVTITYTPGGIHLGPRRRGSLFVQHTETALARNLSVGSKKNP